MDCIAARRAESNWEDYVSFISFFSSDSANISFRRLNLVSADRASEIEMYQIDDRRAATIHRPALVPLHDAAEIEPARFTHDGRLNHAWLLAGGRAPPLDCENVAADVVLQVCPFFVRDRFARKTARGHRAEQCATEQHGCDTPGEQRFRDPPKPGHYVIMPKMLAAYPARSRVEYP
jgi:hypothetical protein